MKYKYTTGFSLIEMLIAVIILGMSALFLAKLNGIMLKSSTSASDRQYATQLATGALDDLRQVVRSPKLRTLPDTLNGIDFSAVNPQASSNTAAFTITRNFAKSTAPTTAIAETAVNLNDDNQSFRTQINIEWIGADGSAQNVVLVTSIRPESAPAWVSGVNYVAGTSPDIVKINGRTFKALQDNTSSSSNKPPATGSSIVWERLPNT